VRYQGVADEAVVAVKPTAEEGVVTYPRTKLAERDREVGGEGRNKETVLVDHYYSSGMKRQARGTAYRTGT
jgi:hypothetical protein